MPGKSEEKEPEMAEPPLGHCSGPTNDAAFWLHGQNGVAADCKIIIVGRHNVANCQLVPSSGHLAIETRASCLSRPDI